MDTFLQFWRLLGCGVLLLTMLAACDSGGGMSPTPVAPTATALAPPSGSASRTPQSAVPTVTGYSLRVSRGDQTLKQFAAADLLALPQQTYTIGGREMSGAPLRQVLALAGVTAARQLTITGTNSQRSGPATVTLAWVAITDVVLLGVNQRGAGKLFGPNLPGDQWVVDVTEIRVED